jgi:hypothetical protein
LLYLPARRRKHMNSDLSLTRQEVVQALALAGATLGALPLVHARDSQAGDAGASASAGQPVVSFFMDQPYMDYSGTALPYHAPLGARSAQPVAHLSEAQFRSLHCCA